MRYLAGAQAKPWIPEPRRQATPQRHAPLKRYERIARRFFLVISMAGCGKDVQGQAAGVWAAAAEPCRMQASVRWCWRACRST